MKKILSFLAVAIVAAASHAATITWASGTMYIAKDATGAWADATSANRAKGTVTALYLIVDQTTYEKYVTSGGVDREGIYEDWATLTSNATRQSDPIVSGNGGTANWADNKGGSEYAASDGTIYALALYTYSQSFGSESKDFYIAAAGSAFINNLDKAEGAYGSLASSVGSWTPASAVPEPTTVALLALGLAAVGLKRKVA